MNHIYQIQVRGYLTDDWSDWFAGLRINRLGPTDTLLVGQLDQTALHGVLARIRDLNLTLIAVSQVSGESATNEGSQQEQGEQDRL
jgi:hypothetical protein